jgi:hypothetical protein
MSLFVEGFDMIACNATFCNGAWSGRLLTVPRVRKCADDVLVGTFYANRIDAPYTLLQHVKSSTRRVADEKPLGLRYLLARQDPVHGESLISSALARRERGGGGDAGAR